MTSPPDESASSPEKVGLVDALGGRFGYTETDIQYEYETPYGTYLFGKIKPHIMSLLSKRNATLITASSFVVKTSYGLGQTYFEVLEASPDVFRASYRLTGKSLNEGMMTIEYAFKDSSPPKVTASLVLTPETSIRDYNIAWVLHTSDSCLERNSGDEYRFSLLPNPEPVDVPENQVNVVPCDGDSQQSGVIINWEDAHWGRPSAGLVGLFGLRRPGLIIDFKENVNTVDPIVVESSGMNPLHSSIQRKTFQYGGYYWAFYHKATASGIELKYRVSHDGISWQQPHDVEAPEDPIWDLLGGFDVAQAGGKVAVAYYFGLVGSGCAIWVSVGQISTNAITWTGMGAIIPDPLPDPDLCFSEPVSVAVDTNGKVWVSASYYDLYPVQWEGNHLQIVWKVWMLDDQEEDPEWAEMWSDYRHCLYAIPICVPENYLVTTRLISMSHGRVAFFYIGEWGMSGPIYLRWLFWNPDWSSTSQIILTGVEPKDLRGDKVSISVDKNDKFHMVIKECSVAAQPCVEDRLSYYQIESTQASPPHYLFPNCPSCSPDYPVVSVDPLNGVHVFWTESGTDLMYRKKDDIGWGPNEDNFNTIGSVTQPSSPQSVSDKAFLIYQKNGNDIWFASWPLPLSVSSGSVPAWRREGPASGLGGYSNSGESISPSTGLLSLAHDDITIPGRNGLALVVGRIFQTPRVFKFESATWVPYLFEGFPYANLGQGWSLNYPWIKFASNEIHLSNGMVFHMLFDSDIDKEYVNHDGVHFTILRDELYMGESGCYKLIHPSGLTYMFHSDGRPWEIWNKPFDPTTKIYFEYTMSPNQRLSYVEDDPGKNAPSYFGRRTNFCYVDDKLKYLKRGEDCDLGQTLFEFEYHSAAPDFLEYVEESGTNRRTSYDYGPISFGSNLYLLKSVDYSTGAHTEFDYDWIYKSTDAISYVVKKHSIKDDSENMYRESQFEYESLDGNILFTRVKHLDSDLTLKVCDEFAFVGSANSVVHVKRDGSSGDCGTQLNRERTWFDDRGQVSQIDVYPGITTEPLYSATFEYDEWGNVIYSRDPMGHEKFSSYSSRDGRNRFFGPGVLVEQYIDNALFDDFSDRDVSDWTGEPIIEPNYFYSSPPSIRVDSTNYASHEIAASDRFLWTELELRPAGQPSKNHIMLLNEAGQARVHLIFYHNAGEDLGRICYVNGATCNDILYPGNDPVEDALRYQPEVWYDLSIRAEMAPPDPNVYNVFLNGVEVAYHLPMEHSGPISKMFFESENSGYMFISRVNLYEDENKYSKDGRAIRVDYQGPETTLYGRLVNGDGAILDVNRIRWTGAYNYFEFHGASDVYPFRETYLEIFDHDGEVVYTTPFKMNMAQGFDYFSHTDVSNLDRTGSGFWKENGILLDEETDFDTGWPWGSTQETWNGDSWIWSDEKERLGAHGTFDVGTADLSQQSHKSEYQSGGRSHGFYNAVAVSISGTDILKQYIYIPSSAPPTEIAIRYHRSATSDWGTVVHWGPDLIDRGSPRTYMGPMPDIYDRWLMILIKPSDVGVENILIDGIEYMAYGGVVYWDFSAIDDKDTGSKITVSGLELGDLVTLYDKTGAVLASSEVLDPLGTTTLDLFDPGIYYVYPIEGYFEVYGDSGSKYYITSIRDNIWAGDEYFFTDPRNALPSDPPHFNANYGFLTGTYEKYVQSNLLGTLEKRFGRFSETTPQGDIEFYVEYDGHLLRETKGRIDDNRWHRFRYEYYSPSEYENMKSLCDYLDEFGICYPGYKTEYQWSSDYQGTYLTEVKNTLDGFTTIRTHFGFYFDTGNLWFEQDEKGIQAGNQYRTEYDYDVANRMTKTTYPQVSTDPRAEILVEYDNVNTVMSVYNENGHRTDSFYDELGRPFKAARVYDTGLESAAASFLGEASADYSGRSVAFAGDVNGDGYDDILIGAYTNSEGAGLAGQTYLILGKASGWTMDIDLSNADASFLGEDWGDHSGHSVAGVGDVNWDGYDDILIGAPDNNEGGTYAGQTYLILGKASGWTMDTDLSNADASFIGENAGDNSGWSVAGAGDVNYDGYDDILIGAFGNDEGGANAGQTYLILGGNIGWTMDIDLSNADASFIGENPGDYAGWSVAGAGDVNGDIYGDILIGAVGNDDNGQGAGQTYLMFGKFSGWSMDTDLSNADASFWGENMHDNSGASVNGSGDVNGDGYADILIGAYGSDEGGSDARGQTYLIFGKDTGWSMDTDLSNADASFWGENALDYSGYSVAGAGDVNGDRYDDILIGAYRNDESDERAGQTYLIFGKDTGWSMDTDLLKSDASFWGESAWDHSGRSVTGAGDANGDGYDDILIGANGNDEGDIDAGQTYLVGGKASGLSMDMELPVQPSPIWADYSWVEYTYNWNDKVTSEEYWGEGSIDPIRSYSYEYYPSGRLKKIIYPSFNDGLDPDSNPPFSPYTDIYYDDENNGYSKFTNGDSSSKKEFFFDWNNRLLTTTEMFSGTHYTNMQYDEIGNMIQIDTDAESSSETTDYVYDNIGRLLKIQYADGTEESFSYSDAGDPLKYVDRNGQEIDYIYIAHLLLFVVYEWREIHPPEIEKLEYIRYQYDLNLNINRMEKYAPDSSGSPYVESQIRYVHDERNRPTEMGLYFLPITEWEDILPPGEDFGIQETIRFDYDDASNLKEYTIDASPRHDSWQVVRTFDAFDRTEELSVVGFHESEALSFEYFEDDAIKTITHANGLVTSYDYWEAGLPKGISVDSGETNWLDIQYAAYHEDMNLELVSYSYNDHIASGVQRYSYDELDRVTSFSEEREPFHTDPEVFTYDAVGNRLTKTGFDEGEFDYQYLEPNNRDQLTKVIRLGEPIPPALWFVYDNNGNIVERKDETYAWTFDYDKENQLTQIMRRPRDGTPGVDDVIVAQFFYDPLGRRIMVAELYDTIFYNFVAYVYINNQPVYEWNYIDETSNFLTYANGFLLLKCDPDGHPGMDENYHQDALGNVRMVTGFVKQVIYYTNYRPFGQKYDATPHPDVEYGYSGKPEDPLTGLYYYGARYYDPVIGRFITDDPLEGSPRTPQSLNPYAYVLNNPLRYSDPTGAQTFLDDWWQAIVDWYYPPGDASAQFRKKNAPFMQNCDWWSTASVEERWGFVAGQVVAAVFMLAPMLVIGMLCAGTAGIGCAIAGLAVGIAGAGLGSVIAPEVYVSATIKAGGTPTAEGYRASAYWGAITGGIAAGAFFSIGRMSAAGAAAPKAPKIDVTGDKRFKVWGQPNSVVYKIRGGQIRAMGTYNGRGQLVKRVDFLGPADFSVDTPHYHILEWKFGNGRWAFNEVKIPISWKGHPPAWPW